MPTLDARVAAVKAAVLACVVVAVGCVETPPRAVVHVRAGGFGLGRAVLVLPTRCTTDLGDPIYCSPRTYAVGQPSFPGVVIPETFAPLVDPGLRLKLEFAGYTLAEAAAMQVTTGDRVDTRSTSASDRGAPRSGTTTQVTPGIPLVSLDERDLVAVARSLQVSAIVSSTLRVMPDRYGQKRFELTVALRELDRAEPAWTVTCSEIFLSNVATSSLLGNCVGNGILAVFAPGNLMGRPL